MNLVEVWFSIIERQAIHRGTFRSVGDLNAKIRAFITGWNDRSHPFAWTKTADQVLNKANRQKTSDARHQVSSGWQTVSEAAATLPTYRIGREGAAVAEVVLREIEDGDLDGLFEQMRDAESVRMAAFVSRDPNDREAFDAHMARVRSTPGTRNRAITRDGLLVGSIASFVIEGDTEITYWIDRSVWGQGVASTALTLFLQEQQVRPLHARAASDNAGSLRVLQKAGFRVTGTEVAYANARGAEIEETILRLD
jgi:RimJ/RimL family protein N-acetyltransferase